MNKTLIKIGTQFYEMDNLSLKLTPVDTPENVETLDFFDGTKIASYVDSSYDGSNKNLEAVDKFNEKVKTFKEAKSKATTREEIEAAAELKPELAVFKHAIDEKKVLAAELAAEVEEEKIEETPKENTGDKPDEAKTETVEGDNVDTDDKQSETLGDTETVKVEETTEKNDENGETSDAVSELISDDELNKLLDEENLDARELVKTAAVIVRENRAVTASTETKRGEVDIINDGIFERTLKRDKADFVVASAGINKGETLKGGSNDFWSYLSETWNEAFFSGHEKPKTLNFGAFRELNGPMTQTASVGELDRRTLPKPSMTASGEVCDVEDRNSFITCDNLGNDLTGLFQTLSSDKCEVRFRKDISMWKLAPGITYWSKKRYADYCAARDELNAAVNEASNPATAKELAAISALQAKVATLQKRCADVGCLDWTDTTSPEDISACLNYSKRQEQCSEMEIRRHLELLEKMFLRARNSHLLKFIDDCSVIVEVDACDFGGLDICHIVDEVVENKTSLTDEKERRNGSDRWIGIAQDRFMRFLSTGPRKGGSYAAGNEGYVKRNIEGLDQVLVTVDNYAAPIDPNDPDSDYDLIPVPDTLGNTYPEPGTVLQYSQDCQYETDWVLYVLDPTEGFALRKPDTRLNAAFTHDSAKGNWVNGPFMENTVGYGKDGCTPWYKFVFKNAFNSGARYADVPAQGICPPVEAEEVNVEEAAVEQVQERVQA